MSSPRAIRDRLEEALASSYRLEGELGHGGMATVYRARDLKHQRTVAIKVLKPELAATIGPERFLHEIRLTANLQHGGIVPLFDSGNADGILYYVMPFLEGETLRERLARTGPLPIAEAVDLTDRILAALEYAHGQGIIHRDIKPENILLRGDEPLLADFGIALAVAQVGERRLTETGLSIGTPEYMSPEQALGTAPVDARSDLYSLGCVLHEMLVGEPPHRGSTSVAVLAQRITTDSLPTLRRKRHEIPRQVDLVTRWVLARDPDRRFPAAADFRTALRGGRFRPVSPEGEEYLRTNRRIRAAVVAVLVLGAIALGIRWSRARRAPASAGGGPVVAVLPFRNLGAPTDQYFAEGLSEEISTRLARVPRIALVSRRNAERFRGRDLSAREIARALHATHVLDGTVRWDRRPDGSSRIRVVPALVEAEQERELWSQSYDAALADVFQVQSGIAEQVATALGVALGGRERDLVARAPTTDLLAYDHWLKGNTRLARRTPESVLQAIDEYQAALQADTGFVQARARLGYAYGLFLDWGWPMAGKSRSEIERLAVELAEGALARDSTAAETWLTKAYIMVQRDPYHLTGAIEAFERSLALDSTNAETHYQYGQALMILWRDQEAMGAYRRAIRLEPERPMTLVPMATLADLAGRADEARRLADSALAATASTPAPYALVVRGMIYLRQGEIAVAQQSGEYALAVDSSYPLPARTLLARAAAARGDTARARAEVALAEQFLADRQPSTTDARFLAAGLIAAGYGDRAVDLIERARPRGAYLSWYLRSADFDPIRRNPRFQRIVTESDPREVEK
jgi:serine/threonine-protein kinase